MTLLADDYQGCDSDCPIFALNNNRYRTFARIGVVRVDHRVIQKATGIGADWRQAQFGAACQISDGFVGIASNPQPRLINACCADALRRRNLDRVIAMRIIMRAERARDQPIDALHPQTHKKRDDNH